MSQELDDAMGRLSVFAEWCAVQNNISIRQRGRDIRILQDEVGPKEQEVHMLIALRTAANKFTSYAKQHREKHTPESDVKAEVNEAMARLCEAAMKPKESTE
jgi:hypothetical protein